MELENGPLVLPAKELIGSKELESRDGGGGVFLVVHGEPEGGIKERIRGILRKGRRFLLLLLLLLLLLGDRLSKGARSGRGNTRTRLLLRHPSRGRPLDSFPVNKFNEQSHQVKGGTGRHFSASLCHV
jgi:hypothetical protein